MNDTTKGDGAPKAPSSTDRPSKHDLSNRLAELIPADRRSDFLQIMEDHGEVLLTAMVVAHKEEEFYGPIPPPELFKEYETILPGAAERILKMAEDTLTHRHDMERMDKDHDAADIQSGRRYGFAALLVVFGIALISMLNGATSVALSALGVGVAGIIGAFIYGRRRRSD